MTTRNPLLVTLLTASLAACGGGDYAPSGDTGGGGNVGFGGAQDIGQFRDILESGGIPGPATLDANGFMNEHFIELPPPDCGQVLCGHAMVSVGRDWVERDYQAALQVAMNTPVDPTTLERLPLNMVVVVDTSGSMDADNRIGYARDGLHLLVDSLEPGDRIALVEYNTEARVITELGAFEPAALHAAIDRLYAGGSTNIYEGLERGLQMVANAYDPERQNRVILLSDGVATAGNTSDRAIIEMSERYIAEGVGLTTIGVGTSFNVELMRGLSERGAGNFYFLEDSQAIAEVFEDELDFFVSPLALEVRIEVVSGPSYRIGEVVGTKLWKTEGETGAVYLPAVFVASRTSAEPDPNGRRGGGSTIFARMIPESSGTSADPNKVAEVRISYRLPGSNERIEQVFTPDNPLDPGLSPEETWFSHLAMAKNYAVYNIYLGLRAATISADRGDYYCAAGVLAETSRAARAWNADYQDPDVDADVELIAMFQGNLRSQGASVDELAEPLEACAADFDPYDDPYGDDYYGDDVYYDDTYACSAGGTGGTGSLALIGVAIAAVVRRRRRGYSTGVQ